MSTDIAEDASAGFPKVISDTAHLNLSSFPATSPSVPQTEAAISHAAGTAFLNGKPVTALKTSRPIPAPPRPAFLRVLTRPPHARVLLDGREIGLTPLIQPVQVTAGNHVVELLRADCAPLREQVEFPVDDTLELRRELTRLAQEPR